MRLHSHGQAALVPIRRHIRSHQRHVRIVPRHCKNMCRSATPFCSRFVRSTSQPLVDRQRCSMCHCRETSLAGSESSDLAAVNQRMGGIASLPTF
ncbi:hypothetical protein CBR_g39939 [Chara braunii]|uniref:Uncharacterized protein n=1 Tax=Chara braunii TaxID=69332 RepID=A0A388K1N4_CHABU|nr:hypothetical protein CBR_g39939 [Chara braunii]|eukprot:GBG63935.1 hypothetical protein CBR_g39939 [Chara braunii]